MLDGTSEAPCAPSPSRRAAKRLRAADDTDDGGAEGRRLPSEIWAGVMEYLPFQSILSCGAVSRSMLHDVMPLLTRLRIDKSSQMNHSVVSRFPDVREIQINSLLRLMIDDVGEEDEMRTIEVDHETKNRVVSFVSAFDKLERVNFGGKTDDGDDIEGFSPAAEHFWEGDEGYPNEGGREAMLAFLDHLSSNFSCRALPQKLEISGLCCPDSANSNTGICETCMSACRKWPLQAVLRFECMRSSIDNARSGRSYGLDVCLERAQIESIIESRPGGHDLLRSDQRLLYQLGRGRLYKIASHDGKTLHIIKYTPEHLDEIKRVIKYAELDVKRLSAKKLSDAVMRSFVREESGSLHATTNRYLSEASLDYLAKDACLNIDREELCGDKTDLLGHAQQVARVVKTYADDQSVGGEDYSNIQIDCLGLLRRISELRSPPIHEIVEAIPSLVQYLGDSKQKQEMAMISLKNILLKGTERDRNRVVGEPGAIQSFSRKLASTNDGMAQAAVMALDIIVANEGIEAVFDAALIFHRLVNLLDSKDVACVQSALRVLAATEAHQMTKAIDSGLFSHLVRLLLQTNENGGGIIIGNCSILLRNFLKYPGQNDAQRFIDANLVPRLIQLLEANGDSTSQINLAHVMVHLGTRASGPTRDTLVHQEGFLAILCKLMHSPDEFICERATATLGNIATDNAEFCELVLYTGIGKPLTDLLEHPNSTSIPILRAASKTFAICSQGESFAAAGANAWLQVATKTLASCDLETVTNTCWALYHLLSKVETNVLIDDGFIERLLKILARGLPEVQEAALRSIYLISAAGGEWVQSMMDCNGLQCIKATLMLSSDTCIQMLSCLILSNIIDDGNDENHIQTILDAGIVSEVVPSLIHVWSCYGDAVRSSALWLIYQLTKWGTAAQIDYLVYIGCIEDLCNVIGRGYYNSVLALWALENILRVGKKYAIPSPTYNTQLMERKLEELIDENERLETHSKRAAWLERRAAWLEFDAYNEHTQSLNTAFERLKKEHAQELKEIESKRYSLEFYGMSPKKWAEPRTKAGVDAAKMLRKHRQALVVLNDLREKAEKIAPRDVWYDRLAEDRTDLDSVKMALKESSSIVTAITSARFGDQRRKEIDAIRTDLTAMFDGDNEESESATSDFQDEVDGMDVDSNREDSGAGKSKQHERKKAKRSTLRKQKAEMQFQEYIQSEVAQKSRQTVLAEEQMNFTKCEEVFLPMMERLTKAKDAADVRGMFNCIGSIMDQVELLTPSFQREYPLGRVVQEVRKAFERICSEIGEQCKRLTAELKRVYNQKVEDVPKEFKPVKNRKTLGFL